MLKKGAGKKPWLAHTKKLQKNKVTKKMVYFICCHSNFVLSKKKASMHIETF